MSHAFLDDLHEMIFLLFFFFFCTRAYGVFLDKHRSFEWHKWHLASEPDLFFSEFWAYSIGIRHTFVCSLEMFSKHDSFHVHKQWVYLELDFFGLTFLACYGVPSIFMTYYMLKKVVIMEPWYWFIHVCLKMFRNEITYECFNFSSTRAHST